MNENPAKVVAVFADLVKARGASVDQLVLNLRVDPSLAVNPRARIRPIHRPRRREVKR